MYYPSYLSKYLSGLEYLNLKLLIKVIAQSSNKNAGVLILVENFLAWSQLNIVEYKFNFGTLGGGNSIIFFINFKLWVKKTDAFWAYLYC
jgi:hypothetical protein